MPSHERTLRNSLEESFDRKYFESREQTREQLKCKLQAAGFSEEHTQWVSTEDYTDICDLAKEVDEKTLTTLTRILPYGLDRATVFGQHPGRDEFYRSFSLIIVDSVHKAVKVLPTVDQRNSYADDIRSVLRTMLRSKDNRGRIGSRAFSREFTVASIIISDPQLYAIFGKDSARVMAHIAQHRTKNDDLRLLIENLRFLKTERGKKVLAALSPLHESALLRDSYYLYIVSDKKDLIPIITDHFQTDQSWAATITSLDAALCTVRTAQFREAAIHRAIIQNFARVEAIKQFIIRHPQLVGRPIAEITRVLEDTLEKEESRSQKPETDAFEADVAGIVAVIEGQPASTRFGLICHQLDQLGEAGLEQLCGNIEMNEDEFARASGEKIVWLNQAVARARKMEHPRHPLISRGLAIKTGFEVEMSYLTDAMEARLGPSFFEAAELLGFHKGGDQFEAAPGPFFDPRTGLNLMEMLFDAGIASLHRESGWSFHYNVNLTRKRDMADVVWPFYVASTADAYEFYNRGYRAERYLRLYHNSNSGRQYIEGKVFRIMTKEQFAWTYESATTLVVALEAYRRTCDLNGALELSVRDLQSCRGDKIDKDLARVWLNFRHLMKLGLRSCGLSDFSEGDTVSGEQQKLMHQQQALVFPTVAARYDPLPEKVRGGKVILADRSSAVVQPLKVTAGGRTWITPIHFATDIINEAVESVNRVLGNYENWVRNQIGQIDRLRGQARRKAITELFVEVRAKVPENASWNEKETIYAEIRGLYVS